MSSSILKKRKPSGLLTLTFKDLKCICVCCQPFSALKKVAHQNHDLDMIDNNNNVDCEESVDNNILVLGCMTPENSTTKS